jgi:ATP-dependent Lon protease
MILCWKFFIFTNLYCDLGVCMGLAWTSHGGSTLYIETLKQQRRKKGKESADETGNGGIEFTGKSCKFLAPKN